MELWQSITLAIVEGLTEYLPISSTGHIILASWLMGIHEQPFTKDFTIMVQFGAILAVVVIYWRRFLQDRAMYARLVVAFLPAGVIGLLVKGQIDVLLGSVWVVAFALLIGGIALIYTKRIFARRVKSYQDINALTWRQALWIGLFQCLAFIPGMSRAASTIWGGLFVGLSLPLATQFSFLLAVPTLAGATFLKALKIAPTLTPDQLQLLVIGNLVSFVVGYLSIRGFINWVSRRGLESFGYYRVVVALLVLALLVFGQDLTLL